MARFEKHIPTSMGSSVGLFTISTASATYVDVGFPSIVKIDTTQYSGATYYYEATFKTSAGTAGCGLLDKTAASIVTSSDITTTSTSVVRVRSTAITPTSGNDFYDQIKCSGGSTNTFYGGRVVVEQNIGAIANTESQVLIFSYNGATTTSATYVDIGTVGMVYFLHTAANWDGTINRYFEATFKTSAATGYASLTTNAGAAVTNGEVTTTSTSYVRVRGSSSMTLVDGTTYKGQIKNDATNTTSLYSCRLIIQQSATPTKTESYMPAANVLQALSATAGVFQDSLGRFSYDSTKWSVDTINWYAEFSRNSSTAAGTLEMYALTSATRITGSNVATTADVIRQRSGTLTMPTSQDIATRGDSAAGTIYQAVSHLLVTLVWTNIGNTGNFFGMF